MYTKALNTIFHCSKRLVNRNANVKIRCNMALATYFDAFTIITLVFQVSVKL